MNTEIEILPGYPHQVIIEKYKFLPGDPNCKSREYEIFPDGYFDLAFLLSDTKCGVFLAGPYTQRIQVPLNHAELFIIRFRVGRVPELLDIKPSELVDTMIQLPRIFGMQPDDLCEILWAEKSFEAKRKVIEELMDNMESHRMMKNKIYRLSTDIIESCGGQIKVNELAGILGVSTRTLERKFFEILGLSPKQFIRFVRFQNTVEKLKRIHQFRTYADLAHESGYSDQPHFIREFKSLSGMSPVFFNKMISPSRFYNKHLLNLNKLFPEVLI